MADLTASLLTSIPSFQRGSMIWSGHPPLTSFHATVTCYSKTSTSLDLTTLWNVNSGLPRWIQQLALLPMLHQAITHQEACKRFTLSRPKFTLNNLHSPCLDHPSAHVSCLHTVCTSNPFLLPSGFLNNHIFLRFPRLRPTRLTSPGQVPPPLAKNDKQHQSRPGQAWMRSHVNRSAQWWTIYCPSAVALTTWQKRKTKIGLP